MQIIECNTRQDDIVDIHLAAFPGFFLTSMGRSFLRLMYSGFFDEPRGICLVAEDNGDILGFVAGTTDPTNFFSSLLRRKWFLFAAASVPGLLRNPLFVTRKCLGALFYRGESPVGIPDAALLSSLAVAPSAGGRGIGQLLVHAFVDKAKKAGCSAVYLTTDEADNMLVNRFYSKCGFELMDTFERPGNRVMNRWVLRFE